MLLKRYLTTLLLLFFSMSSYADQYQGRVIKVIDGDTVWVKSSNKHIKIRLSYIDAPELKQTYGIRSKNFLIELVLNKEVQINTNKKDRYNRHLGELYIHNSEESIFVNAKMIKSGNARVYKTYRNKTEALKNAKKIIKFSKADAVKLEGGKEIIKIIEHLRRNKINVMGHLGILPQSQKGKFRYKGQTILEKKNLLRDAKLLQKIGVFSIVLECIETNLAKKITKELKIPTIGIGSSVNCDGQVLVIDDLIGLSQAKFRFVKKYANVTKVIENAVRRYKLDVEKKQFPKKKHKFST